MRPFWLISLGLSAACFSAAGTAPGPSVVMTVSLSKGTLSVGESTFVIVGLQNRSQVNQQVNDGGCVGFVVKDMSGAQVAQDDPARICAAVLHFATLAPGQEIEYQPFVFSGRGSDGTRLRPGSYYVSGRPIGAGNDSVSLTILP